MTEQTTFSKDPQATLDYVWDWSAWLGDDTIATHAVVAATGLTVASTSTSAGKVTAWISGGTDRQEYAVTCTITTTGGRTDERTSRFQVNSR